MEVPTDRVATERESHHDVRLGASISPAELAELVGAFNEVTSRLQATHETLQGEVSRLKGELTDARRQLQRAQELAALGEMAAGIAHEVRNPLGSIGLYASMLVDDLCEMPEQYDLAEKIQRSVRCLDGIVTDVLTFAREIRVCPQRCQIESLFEHAVHACRCELDEARARVEGPEACQAELECWCDATLIQQCLVNVLRNACEAVCPTESPERPFDRTIRFGAEQRLVLDTAGCRTPMMVLWVADSGLGLSDDVIARAFNPFFTTRAAGTGLGLAIVHRIVDAHGGRVQLGNDAHLGGARVELLLPLQSSECYRETKQS